MLKYLRVLKYLNFEFQLKKSKILVIGDKINFLLAKKILPNNTILTGYPEKLNFFILLISILKKKKTGIFLEDYLINYIEFFNPKIIINFYDNYIRFYNLKKYFDEKIFIAVQNGYRGGPNDFFATLNNNLKKNIHNDLRADYIFTFNNIVGNEYKKYIKCKTISIGSFRNNFFNIKKSNDLDKSITYISSYTPVMEKAVFSELNKKSILFDDFYLADKYIFKNLNQYCLKNNLKLNVLLKTNNFRERLFYNKIKVMNVNFLKGESQYSSYDFLNKNRYFVGTENTLTYEALARKNRVAMFSIRRKILSKNKKKIDTGLDFYWPGKMPDSGKYWSHSPEKKIFFKILNFMVLCSDLEWEKEQKKLNKNYKIEFDSDNTKFKSIIAKYLKLN